MVAGDGKGPWQNLKCITSFLLYEFGPNCNDSVRAQRDTVLSAHCKCLSRSFREARSLRPLFTDWHSRPHGTNSVHVDNKVSLPNLAREFSNRSSRLVSQSQSRGVHFTHIAGGAIAAGTYGGCSRRPKQHRKLGLSLMRGCGHRDSRGFCAGAPEETADQIPHA